RCRQASTPRNEKTHGFLAAYGTLVQYRRSGRKRQTLKVRRYRGRAMLGGKGFCCALLLLVSTGALAQSADDIKDGKVCANCHADAPLIWGGKHGTKADSRTPIAIVGCATCHGDPSEHLKSGSPMPNRFSKMSAHDKNEVCQSCHQGRERMHWPGSTHERNDVSCSSCHKLHTAHDRVHDKLTQPEVCFACHMEKRGPFVRTHQPVQEDCANCHNPHGTTAPNLLKFRQPFLCQQCHEPTSHRGNVASLTGTSTGANTLARGCLNRHTNIHGTNNRPIFPTSGRSGVERRR